MNTTTRKTLNATVLALVLTALARSGKAQTVGLPIAPPVVPVQTITLHDAITRAQSSETSYATAATDAAVAQQQVGIARSALLPGVIFHNQFLYTQGQRIGTKPVTSGTTAATVTSNPIFIANNGVHEYVSQGVVTETLSPVLLSDYRKAQADSAATTARLEIARRGLVFTVVSNYYALLAAEEKLTAQRVALDDASRFAKTSAQLEAGGEVAHADVIKVRLQTQQRQRDMGDAQLALDKARLDLAVLLFADPLTPYSLTEDLHNVSDLPQRDQIVAAANNDNPDLRAALDSFRSAGLEVSSARFAYAPSLVLTYNYGIDASQFAVTSSDGVRNLGYAASATLDIPVFDCLPHAIVSGNPPLVAISQPNSSPTRAANLSPRSKSSITRLRLPASRSSPWSRASPMQQKRCA